MDSEIRRAMALLLKLQCRAIYTLAELMEIEEQANALALELERE